MHVIATEEAFATNEFLHAFSRTAEGSRSPGIQYPARILARPEMAGLLSDIDVRLRVMDEAGIDMQLLSLTSPGVQVFDADTGTLLARAVNDRIAAIVHEYPKRFGGLAAIAPQDPARAADEIRRAVNELGLHGIVINSHTHGEFLDDPKFDPILKTAEELAAPIYIHPTFPPEDMIAPFQRYLLEGALWGFAAETGLHAVRMVMGGVFDRFPNLQIVLGHMGESLPFFLFRLDNVQDFLSGHAQKPPGIASLERRPSQYIRDNIHITTSGMFWDPLLNFCLDVMGSDRIIFAVDYPYEDSRRARDWLAAAPIPDAQKEDIFSRNARKLFRLGS